MSEEHIQIPFAFVRKRDGSGRFEATVTARVGHEFMPAAREAVEYARQVYAGEGVEEDQRGLVDVVFDHKGATALVAPGDTAETLHDKFAKARTSTRILGM